MCLQFASTQLHLECNR